MTSEDYEYIACEGRNLYQLSPLGPSKKGCRSYKAKNLTFSFDAFITSWRFDTTQLHKKCPMSCLKIARPDRCTGHGNATPEIIKNEFENKAKFLIENAKHDNLVKYLNVKCELWNGVLTVFLVQEYVVGKSIKYLCEQNTSPNINFVAEGILQAITFLHKMDREVKHGYLNQSSIFLDESAMCRVADYDLIPYLMYLSGRHSMHKTSDLYALGTLVQSLNDIIMQTTKNFIDQCHSGKVLTHSQLLQHSFVSNAWMKNPKSTCKNTLLEHFDIEKKLGAGAFGIVLQAKKRKDKKSYALKFIVPTKYKKELEQIAREVEIHSKLCHRNIARYITSWKQCINLTELKNYAEDDGFIDDDESMSPDNEASFRKCTSTAPKLKDIMVIQMELCSMTLRTAIDDRNLYKDSKRVWKLFYGICSALNYLHRRGIIHRDLNPLNILLDSAISIAKISDFGLATTTSLVSQQQPDAYHITSSTTTCSSQTGQVGTSLYNAPELCNAACKSIYGVKADIYSLGVIFFEMCHSKFTTQMERTEVLRNLRMKYANFPDSFQNPEYMVQTHIIKQMLNHNARKRPYARQVLKESLQRNKTNENQFFEMMLVHFFTQD